VELSVVVPAYNEADAISITLQRLRITLDTLSVDYEVIVVDDGSRDDTLQKCQTAEKTWKQLRVISLLANRGHMVAISAGMDSSQGDFVVTIDADLQDPPELIGDMLDLAKRMNFDVVYAVRNDRSVDSFFKSQTARIYYWVIERMSGVEIQRNAADFRLMSRRVVDIIQALPEQKKVYRLLVPWFGFSSGEVFYKREARVAGETHYKLKDMASLAVNSVTSFSTAPLKLMTWIGVSGAALSMIFAVMSVLAKLTNQTVPGWTSTILVIIFMGSLNLISLGLIGTYVSKMYSQLQNRPQYLVDDQDSNVE
jgi:glycosyltransferase involved in cell wall biosynthesis